MALGIVAELTTVACKKVLAIALRAERPAVPTRTVAIVAVGLAKATAVAGSRAGTGDWTESTRADIR